MREERLLVKDIEVNYKIAGGGPAIFILHGWGASSDSWVQVMEHISSRGYLVVCPDLPGFGKTLPPSKAWGVQEYTAFVQEFTEKLGVKAVTLLGHSFGGQVSLAFALSHPEAVEKLVLVAPAAIRRKPGFGKKVMRYFAKVLGALLFIIPVESLRVNIKKAAYKALGRRDYMRATGIMREIMVKVIEQDLSPFFSQIHAKTLLLWGSKDALAPLADGEVLKETIPGAQLQVLSGRGHAPNLEVPEELSDKVVEFLKES